MTYVVFEMDPLSLQTTQSVSKLAPGVTDPAGPSNPYTLPSSVRTQLVSMNRQSYIDRCTIVHASGIAAGFASFVSGSMDPPPPITDSYEFRLPISNPNFRKRVRRGEIIMAPYDVGRANVVAHPGKVINSSQYDRQHYFRYKDGCPNNGMRKIGNRVFLSIPGYEDCFVHEDNAWQYANVYRRVRSFTNPQIPVNIQQFVSDVQSGILIDKGLVTGVVADLNRKSFDLLTELAELPSTFSMFTRAANTVVQMCRDFRSLNIGLSRSFISQRRYLQRTYERDVQKLSEKGLKQRSRRHAIALKRQKERIDRDFSMNMNKLVSEFNSKLANAWLSFRYGVSPVIYSANDSINLIDASMSVFSTRRDREIDEQFPPPNYAGWSCSSVATTTDRCVSKKRFAGTVEGKGISPEILFNPAVTIWEIIPLSFVIDWFINVGDYIAASIYLDTSIQHSCCYSWKQEGDLLYEKKHLDLKTFYTFQLYKRVTIDPDDYIGLCIDPTLNVKRIIDSVALMWRPVRRQLLNSEVK